MVRALASASRGLDSEALAGVLLLCYLEDSLSSKLVKFNFRYHNLSLGTF